jgi:hypothetical protein
VAADFEAVAAGGAADGDGGAEGGGEQGGGEHVVLGAGGEGFAAAQEQDVGEEGDDFLDVMGDEDECGRVARPGEDVEEFQEVLARDGVEAGGGFVEEEHFQAGHQGAADEHALAFALGKIAPSPVGEVHGFHLAQDLRGPLRFRGRDLAPKIDLRFAAGEDDVARGLVGLNLVAEAGTDEADGAPDFAPIVRAEAGRADAHLAAGGHEVAGQRAEERGFSGAVCAEDDPVLSALHAPVDLVQDDGLALDAEVFHFKDWFLIFHPGIVRPV